MPILLKQSTASQEVPLGHFVDDTDGKTAETALTIANTDIKIWRTGATTLANKNSGGATHISGGVYYAVLDATDTDTVGPLVIFVAVSGALAVRLECEVLPANVFDARYGSDKLEVDVTQWLGTAAATPTVAGVPEVDITHIGGSAVTAAAGIPEVKVASIANDAITAASIAANAITSSEIADNAITAAKIADGAIDAATFTAGAINAAAIAADAIAAAKIADGAIDRATFAVDTGLQTIRSNTVQAGAAGSVTLDASASAVDDFYNGCYVFITGGTGVGQTRLITDYNGTTKVATVTPNWITNPDTPATFALLAPNLLSAADGLLDRDMSTGTDSGSATVRTVRQALRFLRNKWSISGGTLTVTKEDDSTTSWTSALTTDGAANPVTASDPASS